MGNRKWERWTAIISIGLFVVFIVASIVLAGSPPKLNAPLSEFTEYFGDNNEAFRISAWLGLLAAPTHLFWIGVLWRRMREVEITGSLFSMIAILNAVATAAVAMVAQAVVGVAAVEFRDGRIDAEAMRFYYKLAVFLAAAGFAGLAAFLFATAILCFRNGLFPRSIGWFAVSVAAQMTISSFGVVDDSDFMFSFGLGCLSAFLVWSLVATYYIVRRPRVESPERSTST